MSRAVSIAASYLLTLGAGAAVAWYLGAAELDRVRAEADAAREDLAELRREASDWERVAGTERERTRIAEEEAGRLRIALAAPAPAAPAVANGATAGTTDPPPMPNAPHTGMPGAEGGEPPPAENPENWDMARLRMEVQRLAVAGRRMARSPRLAACAQAARTLGDPAIEFFNGLLKTDFRDDGLHAAAALIAERVEDERVIPALVARYAKADTFLLQRTALRALATLPGKTQVDTLLAEWRKPDADPRLRLLAIHGLARRNHDVGRSVAAGDSPDSTPPLRARAIESLHSFARDGEYADASLLAVFGKALLGADGDGQRRLALLAIEGYWSTGGITALREFAKQAGVPKELADRAALDADAIERGDARPEDAGLPRTSAQSPRRQKR